MKWHTPRLGDAVPDTVFGTPGGEPMGTLSYSPKSQSMRVGAWLIWVLALIAIHVETGWELRSAGPPMAILATLALVVYLSSGVTLSIHRDRDLVRTRRRLLGIPVWSATCRVALEAVELRAAWMGRARAGRTVVYDLVAVGRDPGSDGEPERVVLDLAEDLIFFRLAEARARATAKALGLPVVMRWEAVLEGEPAERRGAGGLDRPLEYPDAMGSWRTWL